MKTFRFPQVDDEYVLIRTFVEGLPSSVRNNRLWFLGHNKHAAKQKFAYEAMSLTKLQEEVREWIRQTVISLPFTSISRHKLVRRTGRRKQQRNIVFQ